MLTEATLSVEKELNPWESAVQRFDEAAELLKLDDGMRKVLVSPSMELTVNIPIVLDDGRIVESGRHEELKESNGRYAYLHALQQGPGIAAGAGSRGEAC